MDTMLHGRIEQWTGPSRQLRNHVEASRLSPAPTPGHFLRDRLMAAAEFLLGLLLSAVWLGVQATLYVAMAVMIPLGPFLLPLVLAPAVLVFGLLILGAGKIM